MSLLKNIVYKEEIPNVDEYLNLRESVNWLSPPRDKCKQGIKNSTYFITVRDNNKLIGMGRVVGDGIFTFHIVDIIVIKEYQKKGIGFKIMTKIMNYITKNKAQNSCINLMAAKGKEDFYRKFGFFTRPTELFGHGMMLDFNN